MKTIFSILILLCSITIFAQNSTTDDQYIADYNKLRGLYLKSVDVYKSDKYTMLIEEFIIKTRGKIPKESMMGDEAMLEWVKNNIEKTKFKNFAEAEKILKDKNAAQSSRPKEIIAFEAARDSLRKVHGSKIFIDVRFNKGVGGSNPKEEPGYAEAYDKLLKQTIEHQKSNEYNTYQSLNREFTKKANYNHRTDKYMFPDTMLDWAIANLSKTMFTSQMDAELAWAKVEDAQDADEKANSEFFDYKKMCQKKYPQMISDVLFDAMKMKE